MIHIRSLKQYKGLSLIELMVTLTIIAILSGVGVPIYSSYVQEGRITECRNEVGAIKVAEEEFALNNNRYIDGFIVAGGSMTLVDPGALQGLYIPSSRVTTVGVTNCTYQVQAGACGNIANCFRITATGVNALNGKGVVVNVTGP
ncbi:MAG: prepilin-type N-terminal cleavage/methylation domain-containing protein [Gammaproteobacteria bacterium]|nr:prepilin-type N-terminal cleavage/methylation domain-containing protein [Gammaproteobacteria bacterium]MDH5651498.1 prepilin-type N-terminal cleavage/methylation domain-containing protein [Gammaproteobacteria bacterium]